MYDTTLLDQVDSNLPFDKVIRNATKLLDDDMDSKPKITID